MRRTAVVALIFGLAASSLPSAAMAAPGNPSDSLETATSQSPSPSVGEDVLSAVKKLEDGKSDAPTLRKKKTPAITLKVSKDSVAVGKSVTLKAILKNGAAKKKVVFKSTTGASSWKKIGTAKTNSKGKAKLKTTITSPGGISFRVIQGKKKSATTGVVGFAPAPTDVSLPQPVNPWPTPAGMTLAADFAKTSGTGALNIPIPAQQVWDFYPIPVRATADDMNDLVGMRVKLQVQQSGAWADVGGTDGTIGTLDQNGETMLRVREQTAGVRNYRVAAATETTVASQAADVHFAKDDQAFYEPPANLPTEAGTMIRAEEVQLDWTHGCYGAMTDTSGAKPTSVYTATNPDCTPAANPKPTPEPVKAISNAIVKNVAPPPWPGCLLASQALDKAGKPEYDQRNLTCRIQGKQYRFMYTTKRFVPDPAPGANGGAETAGTEAATGIILQPTAPTGKIVAWGHPTIGQSNFCSISRGSTYTPQLAVNVGGVQVNLYLMLSWADKMLSQGYTVVMPDYLGVAVQGPTRSYRTYVVGQQEARDIYYAVKASRSPAGGGWPGFPNASNEFVVIGHSQGGHAAMWTGVESPRLNPVTGLTLKGVVAAAPAADLNMVIATTATNYAAWALGPELVQTYMNFLPANLPDGSPNPAALPNIMTNQGNANLGQIQNYCTGNAVANAPGYIPGVANGYQEPQATADPFSYDPTSIDPKIAAKFPAWVVLLNQQTPTIVQGQFNSFPIDLPLQLIQPTDDFVVVAQTNAAMQETFCKAGARMSGYWTQVANSPANLQVAYGTVQLGDLTSLGVASGHGTPLSWIVAAVSTETLNFQTALTAKNSKMGWQKATDFLADPEGSTATRDCTQSQPAISIPSLGTFDIGIATFPPAGCKPSENRGLPFAMPRPTTSGDGTEKNPKPTVGKQDNKSKCSGKYPYGLWPYGEYIYGKAGYTGADVTPPDGRYRWGKYPYNGLCEGVYCGATARQVRAESLANVAEINEAAAKVDAVARAEGEQ
jgi:pimeloyl-ACP methyl ester carboxylesterase